MNTNEKVPARRSLILAICCMSLLVVSMDSTIVNVALPDIRRSLNASSAGLRWVIDAYTVVLASFLMLGGSLGDRFGRRRVFQIGLSLFSLGSLFCSLSGSSSGLIAARMLQGLGGSMMNPVAMAIVVHTFPDPRERARAIGIWGGVAGLSMVLGPLAGGALTGALGWHSIFWINLPIGALALGLTARFVPESRAPRARHADVAGQALLLVMLAALAYALIESKESRPTAEMMGLLAAAALAAFVSWESSRREPLLDPRFFHSVPFSSATVIAVCMFASMGGYLFLGSIYLQDVRAFSAFHAGLCILPMALAVIILSPLSGRLVGAHGARPSLVISGGMLVLSALLMTQLTVDTPMLQLELALCAFGASFGLVNAPVTYSAVSGMPRAQAGLAAAIASTSRQVGTTIGVALTAVLAGGAHPQDEATRQQFTVATHAAWWLFAGLGLLVLLLGLLSTGPWAKASVARLAHLLQEPEPVS